MIDQAQIVKAIKDLTEKDKTTTVIIPLATNKHIRWALVFGWVDGYENDSVNEYHTETECICGKIAYQSDISMMQDYNIDWTMPFDPDTYEVDDTEVSIMCEEDILPNIKWWSDAWNRIKKEYNIE